MRVIQRRRALITWVGKVGALQSPNGQRGGGLCSMPVRGDCGDKSKQRKHEISDQSVRSFRRSYKSNKS